MRLPILNPCTASWRDMSGDTRTRHCEDCDKDVYDLTARTEAEARALLAEKGRVCVRYARNAAGAIVFAAALAGCSSAVPAAPPPSTPAEEVYEMGDVIPDKVDKCPDEPGPNDDGCPETKAPSPDAGK